MLAGNPRTVAQDRHPDENGIHTSAVEFAGDDGVGVGVHIAARLMSVATADLIIVSVVVRDLAFGSGFESMTKASAS